MVNTDRLIVQVKKEDGTIFKTVTDVLVTDLIDQLPPPPPPPIDKPVAIIFPIDPKGAPGSTIIIDGSQSKNTVKYLWSVAGEGLVIKDGIIDQPQVTIILPNNPDAIGLRVNLQVENSIGDRAEASINVIVEKPPNGGGVEKKLVPLKIVASAQDAGKEAALVNDGDFESRWSANGDGQTIKFTYDTTKVKSITKVALTGYWYDRTYFFEIGGKRFENAAGRAPNTLIEYDLKDQNLNPAEVTIIGHGNNLSTYNSYREIYFYGMVEDDGPPPPPPVECPTGQHKDPVTGLCVPDIPPPPPPSGDLVRLLAFADNDTTSGAKAVLSAMFQVQDVSEYEFVGDGPYSRSGTAWVSMMKTYFNTPEKVAKLRISQGNHEHPESESQQSEEDIEAWIPSLNNPTNEGLDWLNAGKVGNVYVISGNTQDMDIEFKRDQFNWLSAELQKAKQLRASGQIDWIVYMCHKPFFTLKSSHSPYTAVRFLYKEMFRDAQVDFVLHGHNHNTQLWLPMIPNDSQANGEGQQLFSLMPDGKTFDFTKDHGQLYIVTGHAGHEWNAINDSGTGVKNVMHYRDSGKFGFTQLDFKGKTANVKSIDSDGIIHFEYNVSRGSVGPPPPTDQAKAVLSLPLTAEPKQMNVRADASLSTADTVDITETTSEGIILRDVAKWVKEFDIPDKNNFSIGIQAIAKKGTSQSIVQKSIQVSGGPPPPPPPPPPDGNVLWDSNIHLKTGQKYTITDTYGPQTPNSKGVWMAASGNPRLIVEADGTFHLEADAGHGRVYIRATNFNSILEGELMFESSSINNTTLRLRSRHNEGGDCSNRFGGFGATVERQTAEYQTESCHNNHENAISKGLDTPLQNNKWYGFRYSCFNNPQNTEVNFKTEYDYKDGKGFITVAEGKHTSPKDYYMDEATFMKESYVWLRINNDSTGSVAYRNVRIIKI